MKTTKGFTLVELLAVMVVLALILVLVAPNVLNSMNSSKRNALVIYAKKMISTAKENVEVARLSGDIKDTMVYSIRDTGDDTKAVNSVAALASDQEQYIGCVKVTSALSDTPTYTIYIVDKPNGIQIAGKTLSQLTNTKDTVTEFTGKVKVKINKVNTTFTGASDKLANSACAQ